jgi:hypothetical protein
MTSDGASALALKAPMASPMPAGSAALPAADAATGRLTVRVVAAGPTAPARRAVVRVNSGKTGAAAKGGLSKPRGGFAVPHVRAARDDRSNSSCVSACAVAGASQLLEVFLCLRQR